MPTCPPNRPDAILFDLDGTLLDSFSAHYRVFVAMFERFGIPCSEDIFLATYSPNWYQTYERMGLARDQWAQADQFWLEESHKHTPNLFPGVLEMLEHLACCPGKPNRPLGVVTSGTSDRVLRDLQRTGIADHFAVIVTGDQVSAPKPHPDGLYRALDALHLPPARAWYIGDAPADWEMARAAGVPFIGVASRFAGLPKDECHVIDVVTDLLTLIEDKSRLE